MRHIILILFTGIIGFTSAQTSCDLYALIPSDAGTYTYDCGVFTTDGNYKVSRGNTCTLTSSITTLPGDPMFDPEMDIPLKFRYDASNNCGSSDFAITQYSIDGGPFVTIRIVSGDTANAVEYYLDTIKEVTPGSTIQTRITFTAGSGCSNWRLFGSENDGMCMQWPLISGSSTVFGGLLPIELVSFDGQVEGQEIRIYWVTANELNNDYFTIERSSNGITFEEMLEVAGAGTSNMKISYQEYDYSPMRGNNYYRLKQTDFDDEHDYSSIISVPFSTTTTSTQPCTFKVIPNPCPGRCDINLDDCDDKSNLSISLIDALGNIVMTKVNINDDSNTAFSIDSRNNLMPGVYIVSGSTGTEMINEKIIVQ
ncbi:MAG: T9SS type A sorting domain-containing protein [Bacteroidetes bacterium]|nr:T9SS type A sorting domain-containing protein [Bacteroidota bacterium]